MRYLCSYPNTYEYGGMRYATVDLGFVCKAEDLSVAKASEGEVTQLLFVRPQEIDTARFGFASVGKIVQRYQAEVVAR